MINFPFETKGKLMVLGVPILKHFRVFVTKNNVSQDQRAEKNLQSEKRTSILKVFNSRN